MPEKRTCSACGAELAADARGGLCAPCALRRVIEEPDGSNEPGEQPSNAQSQSSGWEKISALSFTAPEKPGDQIGRYKLIQPLGEGGCGVVFLAEQEEPVRRRVALKVIKPGMDSKQVLGRFEAERQALALMDHPNIAKVLDAGATSSGRPYFVMEWVKGMRITDYCDHAKLSTRQRLDLFIQVCHAIQHAHQKGIIHRDIKPSNILVSLQDANAMPKVIDFGIAKATTGQPLTDKTIFTALEQFVGTPAYMSPEQAELTALDIDTRSDIYALGVLLYELLTGKTPFEAKDLISRGIDEVRRIIREKDPPRPSTKLSTLEAKERAEIAARRQAELPTLLGIIRGDLDWIVMKAMEKERNRRYETANALALDLQRYLNDEVILARPPSNSYRLRKLIRRHKLAFAAGAAVATSLLVGLAISTFLFVREKAARQNALAEQQRANQQAAIAKAVTTFLLNDLLRQASSQFQADSSFEPNPNLTVREAMDRAAQNVGERFKDQSMVEAAVRAAIGEAMVGIGESERAVPHLQRALELRRAELGPTNSDTLLSMKSLATAYLDDGKNEPAVQLFEEALKVNKQTLGAEHLDTARAMHDLARAYVAAGKTEKALPLFDEALNLKKAKLGPNDIDILNTINAFAAAYQNAGNLEKAVPLFEEALRLAKTNLGPDALDTATVMHSLAGAYNAVNKLEQAASFFEQALKIRQARLVPNHPHTLTTMNNLARVYLDAGDFDKALPLFEQTLKIETDKLSLDHPNTRITMNDLAVAYRRAGKSDLAVPLLESAFRLSQTNSGPNHPDTLAMMHNLAKAYREAGKLEQALPLFEQTLTLHKEVLGPYNLDTFTVMHNFALAYQDAGKLEQAVVMFEQTLQSAKTNLAPGNALAPATLAALGSCLLRQSNYTAAEGRLREALELRQKATPDDWRTFEIQSQLGAALLGEKRFADAEPLLIQGHSGLKERVRKIPPSSRGCLKQAGQTLLQLYEAWGKPEQSNEWRRKLEAEENSKGER